MRQTPGRHRVPGASNARECARLALKTCNARHTREHAHGREHATRTKGTGRTRVAWGPACLARFRCASHAFAAFARVRPPASEPADSARVAMRSVRCRSAMGTRRSVGDSGVHGDAPRRRGDPAGRQSGVGPGSRRIVVRTRIDGARGVRPGRLAGHRADRPRKGLPRRDCRPWSPRDVLRQSAGSVIDHGVEQWDGP